MNSKRDAARRILQRPALAASFQAMTPVERQAVIDVVERSVREAGEAATIHHLERIRAGRAHGPQAVAGGIIPADILLAGFDRQPSRAQPGKAGSAAAAHHGAGQRGAQQLHPEEQDPFALRPPSPFRG